MPPKKKAVMIGLLGSALGTAVGIGVSFTFRTPASTLLHDENASIMLTNVLRAR